MYAVCMLFKTIQNEKIKVLASTSNCFERGEQKGLDYMNSQDPFPNRFYSSGTWSLVQRYKPCVQGQEHCITELLFTTYPPHLFCRNARTRLQLTYSRISTCG